MKQNITLIASQTDSPNQRASQTFAQLVARAGEIGCVVEKVGGATVLDAGIQTHGSLAAGLGMARLCMADFVDVGLQSVDPDTYATSVAVRAQTDHPLIACLGSQYAGWPVQTDDFFAMGSGPMRMARGREEMLKELQLSESATRVVGVLESDSLPSVAAIEKIADECHVQPENLQLAVAPTSTIAGSAQVVARSIETSMHKLHELKFDVRTIVSGTGIAPLSPPAKPGDMARGIGRTNDAMLYGATVTLWVDTDDDAVDAIIDQVPSGSSKDHGRPFADVFKDYEYDFYKIDPMLFSPARVIIHSLRTGNSWRSGKLVPKVLHESFGC